MVSPAEDGDPRSKMLILGQAPSRQEIREGRPFVGPSGEVLQECLHLAGIAKRECYVLNIWPEEVVTPRASHNIYERGSERLLWDPKGFTELGLMKAQPTLERIRSSGANCIFALGQQALELCTGIPSKIMKWRGSILRGMERVDGKKVVASVHPAATIHGVYLWRYLITHDAKRAWEESKTQALTLDPRTILIRPSLKEALAYIKECVRRKRFATDLEIMNWQVSCFSLSFDCSEAMSIPLIDEQGDVWDEAEEEMIWHAYSEAMYDPEVMKINQNLIGFDVPFLAQQNKIITRGPMGDTMVAQSVLYPEFNKGLDMLCSMYTREPYYKDEGKMWKTLTGDWATFWRYNGKDAATALEIWGKQAKELTENDQWAAYYTRAQLGEPPVLTYMTLRGLDLNRDALGEANAAIDKEIQELQIELDALVGEHLNVNSPKQCAKYFYETLRFHPYRNNAGGFTTDDTAMSRIYRKSGLRQAKLVQELRNRKKLKGTYLDVETDQDEVLRCSWNPVGTWTGRLSSSQTIFDKGLQLQNLDPRFKGFIVSREQFDENQGSGSEPGIQTK